MTAAKDLDAEQRKICEMAHAVLPLDVHIISVLVSELPDGRLSYHVATSYEGGPDQARAVLAHHLFEYATGGAEETGAGMFTAGEGEN